MIFKELDVTGLIDFDEDPKGISERDLSLFYAGMKYLNDNPDTKITNICTKKMKDGFEYVFVNDKPFYPIAVPEHYEGDDKE